jgi:hypothetical protein
MAWKMQFTACLACERLWPGPFSCGGGSPMGLQALVLRGVSFDPEDFFDWNYPFFLFNVPF